MVGPAAKREGVAHLRAAMGLSERRACSLVGADRKMIRYRSRRPKETELRMRLRDLANERRRFGYRRLFILLRQEGERSGINRIYRLYREESLAVRKRRARRRAVGMRAPMLVEARANARWSIDFVHDQFASGRRFRILNIVDDVTRECLAAIPETSISGRRVARELTALIQRRGEPGMIASHHGTELLRTPCSCGRRTTKSFGVSSRRESRCRTAFARVSTAACATSVSTKACSSASTTLAQRLPTGSTTTISAGRTRRWATAPRRPTQLTFPQHAIGCASPTSSADRILLHPRPTAYNPLRL
jgi:putative transposase